MVLTVDVEDGFSLTNASSDLFRWEGSNVLDLSFVSTQQFIEKIDKKIFIRLYAE